MRNRAIAEGYKNSREPKNSGINQQLATDSAKIVATLSGLTASMAQLLERLVDQSNHENIQSSNRGFSHENPQEKFRSQRPKEFSGTSDPLAAESGIKSLQEIFEYLQLTDLDRARCAIYMLRDETMIWWECDKLSVNLSTLLR
ncbi:hypothetical protein F511_13195 [Dorcoceras hygrometricum]|uniref:Uncharacterized protein n=1 Tax=Dorcoceras hygrometricum TaxID=472368 RepID=A0A2Z7APC2_9LAMI|nr:hypothetical protein F511_13195 [Dorcoceras hygrometricum]